MTAIGIPVAILRVRPHNHEQSGWRASVRRVIPRPAQHQLHARSMQPMLSTTAAANCCRDRASPAVPPQRSIESGTVASREGERDFAVDLYPIGEESFRIVGINIEAGNRG